MSTQAAAVTVTAAQHQAAQTAIVSALSAQMAQLWPLIVEDDLNGSLPQYQLAVSALVHRYGQASSALAAAYYDAERQAAGVPGRFSVKPATPADIDTVTKGVGWATKGLWSETPDVEKAKQDATATAERYTLNAGRQTIITAANADRKSHGWARVPEPGACSFCLLFATRGAAYRTNTRTDSSPFGPITRSTADFRAHNHCRCSVEPIFDVFYEPSAEVRRAQQIYQQVKKDPTVRGPKATRNAFRTALANN